MTATAGNRSVRNEKNSNPRHQPEWDKQTDVVIVGFGGAGAAAAIEAADAGAEVLVLEKGHRPGGATRMSGGVIYAAGTSTQKAAGIADTAEEMYKYWMGADNGAKDPALVRILADESAGLMAWLEAMGATCPPKNLYFSGAEEEYAHITAPKPRGHIVITQSDEPLPPQHRYFGQQHVGAPAGHGRMLTSLLEQAVKARKVEVMLDTRAEELLTNSEKEVIGVKVSAQTGTLNILARRAVVLADGGFARNMEMQKQFTPKGPYIEAGKILMTTHAGQTGDGIKMAMAVGADLTGMTYLHAHAMTYVATGQPSAISSATRYPSIFVNKMGRRFVNEDRSYSSISTAIDNQDYLAFQVFDDAVMQKQELPETSLKRLASAPTVRELGQKLGIVPDKLEDTIKTWNKSAVSGNDPEFGKKGPTVGPITSAPFWGGELLRRFNQNYGGLKTNTESQVLSALRGTPIPGLYAAGQTTGGRLGSQYPGSGAAILNCLVFGRIAGINAARETRRD